MSSPVMVSDPSVTGDLAIDMAPPLPTNRVGGDAARRVISGTSALGLGILIERGSGFVANILAARFAGAPVFGAYSLAISTANNISTYAAGGIGATAARFSGKYQYGTSGYSTLGRALTMVSLVSALIAAVALWAGAGPIAHLLHKTSLTGLLRWAGISAAGIILLECARGFFVGQRRLAALVLLSMIVGAGMLALLPWAASSHRSIRMIVSQGAVTFVAVAACLLLARPLGLLASGSAGTRLPLVPMLKEVWGFGLVQLASLVGANLSGWWLTALVARSDTTLVQMSFFAIASQLRNLAGLAPGLLTEGSYAVMADPAGEHLRTPHHVMAVCAFASSAVSFLFAAMGILIVPWGLLKLYGSSYSGAAMTATLGLALAVVHMGNAPTAARLSIVSIRATGVINTFWAVFVAISASILLLHGGNAAVAMSIFFAAHLLSALLVLLVLAHKDYVPKGMMQLFVLSSASILSLVLLSFWRERHVEHALIASLLMPVSILCSAALMFLLGKRHDWLPTAAAMDKLRISFRCAMQRVLHRRSRRFFHGA